MNAVAVAHSDRCPRPRPFLWLVRLAAVLLPGSASAQPSPAGDSAAEPVASPTEVPVESLLNRWFPTLEPILAEAAALNPAQLGTFLAESAKARGAVEVAERQRRPSVMVEGFLSGRNEWELDGGGYRFSIRPTADLTGILPLYDFGGIEARQRLARLQKNLADGALDAALTGWRQELRLGVLQLGLAEEALRLATAQADQLDRLATEAEGRVAAGREREITATEARLDADEAALKVIAARLAVGELTQQLNSLAGRPIPPVTHAGLRDALRGLQSLPSNLAHQASTDHRLGSSHGLPTLFAPSPATQSLQQSLRQIEAENDLIRSATRPRLDLVGRVYSDQLESANADDQDRILAEVALRVQWNLFDGGRQRQKLLANQASRSHLERQLSWQAAQDAQNWTNLQAQRDLRLAEVSLAERRAAARRAQATQLQAEAQAGRASTSDAEVAAGKAAEADLRVLEAQFRAAQLTLELVTLSGRG